MELDSTGTSVDRRNLTVLLCAIFCIASGEELWSRFVPNYLVALGGSVLAVSAFGTLKDLLDAVYQFPGGVLTARLGPKNSLLTFNALALTGYAAFALATHWWVLLLALPLVMAWQSFSLPATFSIIGDSLKKGERSVAFAYQSIVRRIPIINFADHGTGQIYAQMVKGRLTSWSRRVFELAIRDDNARAAFEAIAMPPLQELLGALKDDSSLDPRQNVTLGQWGDHFDC